jgi:hypothetical protein
VLFNQMRADETTERPPTRCTGKSETGEPVVRAYWCARALQMFRVPRLLPTRAHPHFTPRPARIVTARGTTLCYAVSGACMRGLTRVGEVNPASALTCVRVAPAERPHTN